MLYNTTMQCTCTLHCTLASTGTSLLNNDIFLFSSDKRDPNLLFYSTVFAVKYLLGTIFTIDVIMEPLV